MKKHKEYNSFEIKRIIPKVEPVKTGREKRRERREQERKRLKK